MNFRKNRPGEFTGKGDKYLQPLAKDLYDLVAKERRNMNRALYLPHKELSKIANILVELGEDLHNDIGLWKSYEQYNIDFFGTPIPLLESSNDALDNNKFSKKRIQHLLWIVYSEIKPNLILAPDDLEIEKLADRVAEFLEKSFKKIPKDSGIKKFLSQSNIAGWDVKRKLIWTGISSYLFRLNYENYISEKDQELSIAIKDDYICQESTKWSGLGVIDILAKVLELSQSQQGELRSWYERHAAFYQILETKTETIKVFNIINDTPYWINVGKDMIDCFKVKEIIFGSLIPWDGIWYWSGEQQNLGILPNSEIQNLNKTFLRNSCRIAYRYSKSLKEKAIEINKKQYKHFLKYFGDDLVIFPDGLAMAVAMQKKDKAYIESKLSKEQIAKFPLKSKLKNGNPDYAYPDEIIKSDNAIGIYFNPDECQEIMLGFDDILKGLKKKGIDLNDDEKYAIYQFIVSDSISPKFVKRVIRDYGAESIAVTFKMNNRKDESYLDFLFRQHKGHFYRNRYPFISLVE